MGTAVRPSLPVQPPTARRRALWATAPINRSSRQLAAPASATIRRRRVLGLRRTPRLPRPTTRAVRRRPRPGRQLEAPAAPGRLPQAPPPAARATAAVRLQAILASARRVAPATLNAEPLVKLEPRFAWVQDCKMDWSDEGIFLTAKPLGEANAVAELFTLGHGRHLGLVRGGRSRRVLPLLQPGNRCASPGGRASPSRRL